MSSLDILGNIINGVGTWFKQSGTGAVARTYQSKFQETISVKDFGAKGDGVTDDTTAIQNAINAANLVGAICVLPGASYYCSAGLLLDNSADSTQTNLRGGIVGTNPHGTVLNFGPGTFNCITMKGSNTNGGADSLQRCENLFVNKVDNLGNGFVFLQHSHLSVINCRVNGSNTGIYCQDLQESYFQNVVVTFANCGLVAIPYTSFTGFNATTFVNCKFGGCNQFGVDIQNGACVNFLGGSIESNTTTNASTVCWGIRYSCNNDSTLQGTSGLNMYGVYLENNGYAGTSTTPTGDVWIVDSTSPSVSNIIGCTFQRHSSYTQNCIRVESGSSASQVVNIIGNGFRGYSDYTASSSRPYWINTSPAYTVINAFGNKQQSSLETVSESLTLSGSVLTTAPSTITASSYTQLISDATLIFNGTATQTITLLNPSTFPGKELSIKNIAAFAVNSASSNVVSLGSASAGTAILAAGPGKWATLQSDGTNWIVIAGN